MKSSGKSSFGKSLGVRVAIGSATILSGVYAAALAQKDRQEDSGSWTADVPSLGQPITPIEGQATPNSPDAASSPLMAAASALGSSEFVPADSGVQPASFDDSTMGGSVQLVQHTEPVPAAEGGMGMPDSLGGGSQSDTTPSVAPAFDEAPAFDPSQAFANTPLDDAPDLSGNENATNTAGSESPNWMLPADSGSETAASTDSPAMTFPAGGPELPVGNDGPTTMGAPVEVSGPAMGLPVEVGPMTDPADATGAVQDLPTAQLQTSPDMQFYAGDDVQYLSTSPDATNGDSTGSGIADTAAVAAGAALGAAGAAIATEIDPTAGPTNLLRSDADGTNTLRQGSPEFSDPTFGSSSAGTAGDLGSPASALGPNQAFEQARVQENLGGPSQPMRTQPQLMPNQGFDANQGLGGQAMSGQGPGVQGTGVQEIGGPQGPQARLNSNPNLSTPPTEMGGSGAMLGGPSYDQPAARISSLPSQPSAAGLPNYPQTFEQPTGALPIQADATLDSPGERKLEGVQTPSVVIHKRAPSEVQVGKPAAFVIQVQNVGTVEALDVIVQDRVPAGMRLVDASPAPVQQGNMLMWQLGSMPAGDERTLTMQLVPEQEGELGSVARVSFEAAASVRTVATRPELKVTQRAPETVLIGQQLEIELEVSNPGTGQATGVVLQEDVPEGLEHPKGRQLDNALGNLAPGEIRKQVLRLRAVAPGIIQNTIRLSGDDGLAAEHTVAVQVVAPDLQVDLKGPTRRYLERQATYQLEIANAGTADATNVELSVQLARGFTFVSTDFEGQYDPSRHAVYWSLAQLPAGQSGTVPLTLLPVEAGEQAIVTDARADLGITARNERTMSVEGFAELGFSISNPGGPIEVGAETVYQIRVVNKGSMADTNVRVELQLPAGLELVSADSEAGTDGQGLIAFQPKPSLAPGDEIKYNVRLRGTGGGTHLVKAVVISDQNKVPVTKEESTKVYVDQ